MDLVKAEKFQAMKKYRGSRFLYCKYFTLHNLLAGLACTIVFNHLYSFWFPCSLCSYMKHFLLTSLPSIWSNFFNPKCLFIVVNVIVIFLVGESRLPPVQDIYSEYNERSRSQSLRRRQEIMKSKGEEEEKEDVVSTKLSGEHKEVNESVQGKEIMKLEEKEGDKLEVEVKEVIKAEAREIMEEEEEEEEEKERDVGEEENGLLPTEELNKRVEEFIARVTKQRWLEAQSLVCCKA